MKILWNNASIGRICLKVYLHKLHTGEYVHTTDYTQNATLEFLRNRPTDRPFAVTVAFYPPKEIRAVRSPKPEYMKLYENVTIPEPLGSIATQGIW
jgi:hypothetical protein